MRTVHFGRLGSSRGRAAAVAQADAEGMERHASEETLKAFARFLARRR